MSSDTRFASHTKSRVSLVLLLLGWLAFLSLIAETGVLLTVWGIPPVLAGPIACILYFAIGKGRRSAFIASGVIAVAWVLAVMLSTTWAYTWCHCEADSDGFGGPLFSAYVVGFYFSTIAVSALAGVWFGYLLTYRSRPTNDAH
jgi:hypothetical protein